MTPFIVTEPLPKPHLTCKLTTFAFKQHAKMEAL